MSADYNRRLVATARSLMGCYARRWKFIRHDEIEAATANRLLRLAVEWREKARQWQQNPI